MHLFTFSVGSSAYRGTACVSVFVQVVVIVRPHQAVGPKIGGGSVVVPVPEPRREGGIQGEYGPLDRVEFVERVHSDRAGMAPGTT